MTEDFLDFLGVPEGPRDASLLEFLFHAFQHRVPFHPARVPGRDPVSVLAESLDPGKGTAGGERARALDFLLSELGYETKLAAMTCGPEGTRDRALVFGAIDPALPRWASVVSVPAGSFVCDAALPVALPLTDGFRTVHSPAGTLSVSRQSGGWGVFLESQGEERCLGMLKDSEAETPVPDDVSTSPDLLRFLPDRVLAWTGGRMEITDAWSRLSFGVAATETAALEGLFGEPLPENLSSRDCSEPAALSVFCATSRSEAELVDILGHPERHLSILPSGTVIESIERNPRGWFWTLTLESSKVREEMVRVEPAGVTVRYGKGGVPLLEKSIHVESRPGGSRLVSTAVLSMPVPPAGPSESVRKTLVFHLASELLALASKESGFGA